MEALANERNQGLREQRVSQQASVKSLERHGPIDSDGQPFRDLQGLVPAKDIDPNPFRTQDISYLGTYAARNRVRIWCGTVGASGGICGARNQHYTLVTGRF